jgi:diacylglycerol O-acyltransferase / wax synthase
MATTRMSAQDALWLTMDRPNSLMVIDTVMWFAEVPDWDKVESVVAERLVERFPVFSRRPVQRASGWVWEDDPAFDLADHVHRVTLPHPGTVRDLQAFVASQRSVPFDKSKPLWAMFLIDGMTRPDGTQGAAVMARFHHAIADGVRLVQVALGLCDLSDGPSPAAVGRRLRRSTTPTAVALSTARNLAGGVADVALTTAEAVEDALGDAIGTVYDVAGGDVTSAIASVTSAGDRIVRSGLGALRNPERFTDVSRLVSTTRNRPVNDVASVGKLALSGGSAATVWSGTPGVDKGAYIAPMLALDDVKAVRRATGTTVNDVLLATVSGTLTRYLRRHGDDSVDEVMWMIPVSVKPFDADLPQELGNHFALVALRLPLGIDDVRTRLREVHERMERIKNSDEALITFGVQRGIAQAPTAMATALTNYFANKAVGVLTNVPGPRTAMTLAGTEVDGVLGWAPCSGDQPMTICIFSYNGKVAVGFGTDHTLVPDGDQLGELFAEEFADMHRTIVERVP